MASLFTPGFISSTSETREDSLSRSPFHRFKDWLARQLAPSDKDHSDVKARALGFSVIAASIFLLALGVRLLQWQDAYSELLRKDTPFQGLSNLYKDEADRILNEGGVVFPEQPVDPGDARMIVHPPGYSILMAATERLFGESDTGVRYIQILCGSAACVMLFLIAAELLRIGVATIAGLLAALSPHLAYYSLYLLPESLAPLPILVASYLVIKAYQRPRLAPVLTAGALIGLSCWFRANALLLAPFLALSFPILFSRGKRLRFAAALIGATALVIAPITIRNWVAYRRFIPVSIGAGITMIQGIADYDKQGQFALPVFDVDVQKKEAEWYGREDYGRNLWKPDGVERDQARFSRGLSVIRESPVWFLGVMCRRAASMLRYNDFLPQNSAFNTSIAPTVLPAPNYGHPPDSTGAVVWSASPGDLFRDGARRSEAAEISIVDDGAILQVASDGLAYREQFASPAISVEPNTDYLLTIPVRSAQGYTAIRVATADPRIVAAQAEMRDPPRKRKERKEAREVSAPDSPDRPATNLEVRFATGDFTPVWIVVTTHKPGPERPVAQIGGMELVKLGPTPNQWTRMPRAVIRGVQKNVFKTERLLPLNLIGIALLALAGRFRALTILLAVPAYYLIVQSAFHTEYRYILGIHYFMFVMGAIALYLIGAALGQLWRRNFDATGSKGQDKASSASR